MNYKIETIKFFSLQKVLKEIYEKSNNVQIIKKDEIHNSVINKI